MNIITLDGRLGTDPEVRYNAEGYCTAKVSLGETFFRRNKSTGVSERRTRWHKCVFFGKKAETISEHATKGTHLLVSGELDYYSFNDSDGASVKVTEIIVAQFQFLGSGKSAGSSDQSSACASSPTEESGYGDAPFQE